MDYLPIFVDLKQRKVLVIGGGEIALRKIELLLNAGADVQVVAKQLCYPLEQFKILNKINYLSNEFNERYLTGIYLIVAATDDPFFNQYIYQLAAQHHILVNCVDDKNHCSFIFPAIIDRSPVMVAISTGGASPILARQLREKLETLLPKSLANTAKLLDKWRDRVKQRFWQLQTRRRFWQQLLSSHFMQLVENHNFSQAERFLEASLNQTQEETLVTKGSVTLVGAGPGDPELLTLKALRILQQADIVLYDALVSDEILDLIRRDAERVFVGKRALNHSMRQEHINELLIDYAKQGNHVVRLKGGDPFIFGRGGEELQALKQHNIPFQIVPGITAAVGAAAYTGIPLTHRDLAYGTTFITGYHTKRTSDINWSVLAQSNHTLVIYMGIIHIAEIAQNLISYGRAADTPVAIVSKATTSEQRVITVTLSELLNLNQEIITPAILIIGEVVALHHQLKWFAKEGHVIGEW